MKEAILVLKCKDKTGIVASLSQLLTSFNANIISMDQYSTDHEAGLFFTRIVFCYKEAKISLEDIKRQIDTISKELDATSTIHPNEEKLKTAILVSKDGHCLNELLHQWQTNQLNIEITAVISNTDQHKKLTHHYNLPYHYIAASSFDRKEADILDIIKDTTDFLILARYMQILTKDFLQKYKKDIINIHHSFLPSFKGANPYKQAKDYGVKIIGATAHFVTEELDEGPIIMQGVERVSHTDTVNDFKRKRKQPRTICISRNNPTL